MKIIFLLPILFVMLIFPVYAQLSDTTGLVNRLDVEAGGTTYEIEVVANFDVINYEFVKDEKRLTLYLTSSLENNLGELIIPQKLLSGNFTYELDDQVYLPKHRSNDKISFVTLNFTGSGDHKLDIISSNILASDKPEPIVCQQGFELIDDKCVEEKTDNGGCLIATATYGSELASQVQQLRELRDSKLLKTESGASFMNSFNSFYYSFSPYIADYERENPAFKEIVKLGLTPMISSLSILNYVDMDSEAEVLGYGISLILLNIGIYAVIPVGAMIGIKKLQK